MTNDVTNDSNEVLTELNRSGDALAGSNLLVDLGPGIFGQQQAGWLVTIETRDGLVQIDTGDQAPASLTLTLCALRPPNTNRSSASIASTKPMKTAHIQGSPMETVLCILECPMVFQNARNRWR